PLARAINDTAARNRCMPIIRGQLQKTKTHLGLGVCRHKGSLALAANQQVVSRQLIDGLAHRALAYLKTRGELVFAGYSLTWLPLALIQPLQQQGFDLLV